MPQEGGASLATHGEAPLAAPRTQQQRLQGLYATARLLEVLSDEDWAALTASVVAGERSDEAVFDDVGRRVAEGLWPFFERVHGSAWASPPEEPLRFTVGASVLVRVGGAWEPARVTALWHREEDWPPAFLAPYQLHLSGQVGEEALLFAPVDSDTFVRAPSKVVPPSAWEDPALMFGYADWEGRTAKQWRAAGMSGLHCACLRGDVACVRRLLRRPLSENQPNEQSNKFRDSALHACVQAESLPCAMLVLAAGGDPRLRNAFGKSALELALDHVGGLRCEWEHAALVQLLTRFSEEVEKGEGAVEVGGGGAPAATDVYL